MSQTTRVAVDRKGRVATVTFDRADGVNVVARTTMDALLDIIGSLEQDDECDVVLLRSASTKTFIMGADVSQLSSIGSSDAVRFAKTFQEMCDRLENLPQVTLAAMSGHTFGGGFEIALACDLRIASKKAKMALPEITLGLIPGGGGTVRLTRALGVSRALEMILTAHVVDGERAADLGLVNHAVESQDVPATCESLISQLLAHPSPALRHAKAVIRGGSGGDLATSNQLERLAFGVLATTSESREGVQAFLDKREPKWRG